MSADDKKQNDFDDLLRNQELTNSTTVEKKLIPEAENVVGDDILDGTWPLVFEGNSQELFGFLLNNFFEFIDIRNILPLGKSKTASLLLWCYKNS